MLVCIPFISEIASATQNEPIPIVQSPHKVALERAKVSNLKDSVTNDYYYLCRVRAPTRSDYKMVGIKSILS